MEKQEDVHADTSKESFQEEETFAFEALEKDFGAVLQELISDKSLEHFK